MNFQYTPVIYWLITLKTVLEIVDINIDSTNFKKRSFHSVFQKFWNIFKIFASVIYAEEVS